MSKINSIRKCATCGTCDLAFPTRHGDRNLAIEVQYGSPYRIYSIEGMEWTAATMHTRDGHSVEVPMNIPTNARRITVVSAEGLYFRPLDEREYRRLVKWLNHPRNLATQKEASALVTREEVIRMLSQ